MRRVCGIILEGPACSGKTSVLCAMKRLQAQTPQCARSLVVLGEHYSQVLRRVGSEWVRMAQADHLALLSNRLEALEALAEGAAAFDMFPYPSHGLFFMMERFHLNHAVAYGDGGSGAMRALEERLVALGAHTAVLTLEEGIVAQRISHRESLAGRAPGAIDVAAYMESQRALARCAIASSVPTRILPTDKRDWEGTARDLLLWAHGEA